MDELINVSVNGSTLKKDYNCAGVQGDCNSTKLRVTFSENWDGYAKTITFWDANGQNPVQIQFGTDLLEDILTSHLVYLVPIPGEAMTEAGENTFVIQGSVDGVVKRTVEGKLKVLPSRQAVNAGNPAEITPTLAMQLRQEIDSVMGEIERAEAGAVAADEAAQSARNAQRYAYNAENAASGVQNVYSALTALTVTAESVSSTNDATVEKTNNGSSFNFHFGIPKGISGVHIGEEAPTDENATVWIDLNGEPDEYVTQTEFTQFKALVTDEIANLEQGGISAETIANIKAEILSEIEETILGGEW